MLEAPLAAAFEKQGGGHVRWVTGASGTLSQQVKNGAPFDVFLSANASYVDELTVAGKLERTTVTSYAVGQVGVLWRDGKKHPINDLADADVRFIALPNPKLAPYGVAAQEALDQKGLWDQVKSKIVYGENVRQALQLFESGNADVVLTADSLLKGKNASILPAETHRPIVQKGAMLTSSKNSKVARAFLQFLGGPAARQIFADYGFTASKQR